MKTRISTPALTCYFRLDSVLSHTQGYGSCRMENDWRLIRLWKNKSSLCLILHLLNGTQPRHFIMSSKGHSPHSLPCLSPILLSSMFFLFFIKVPLLLFIYKTALLVFVSTSLFKPKASQGLQNLPQVLEIVKIPTQK